MVRKTRAGRGQACAQRPVDALSVSDIVVVADVVVDDDRHNVGEIVPDMLSERLFVRVGEFVCEWVSESVCVLAGVMLSELVSVSDGVAE